MKLPLLTYLMLCVLLPLSLWGQTDWMNKGGGIAYDEALDVEVDLNGNVFSTGYIGANANFGNGQVMVSGFGFSDIYLSKSDASGNFLWVKVFGGVDADRSYDIAIDPSGNVYMTGYYSGSADFDGTTITSVGNSQDIFLAKFDNSGSLIWVKSEGGNDGESGFAINFDSQGNVLLTGQFKGTSTIGGMSLTSINLPGGSIPSFDFFIAKYDPNGNPIWVRQGEAPYDDRGLCVSVDSYDNVYVGGQFSDTLVINGVVHNNAVLNAGFLVKFDDLGTEVWFRTLVAGQTLIRDMEVNNSDDVIITGDFQGQLTVLGGSSSYSTTGNYTYRYFVMKVEDNGTVMWDAVGSSESEVSSKAICIDSNQDIYITGTFKCVLDDYADDLGNGFFNSIGYNDVFVTKYSQAGQKSYSYQYGGQFEDYCSGIAITQLNEPIIGGSYNKLFNFNVGSSYVAVNGTSTSIYSPSFAGLITYNNCIQSGDYYCLSSQGNNDIFLGKINDISLTPYYYHLNTVCGDVSELCIEYTGDQVVCSDSITICESSAILAAITYTAGLGNGNYVGSLQPSVGPFFDFTWSNGGSSIITNVFSDGNYIANVVSEDGCFTGSDTVYVDVGATQFVDTIYFDTVQPVLGLVDLADYNDSIVICEGQTIQIVAMDSLTNPNLDFTIPICGGIYGYALWNGIPVSGSCLSYTYSPPTTGWYTFDLSFVHSFEGANCIIDTMHYQTLDSFYVEVIPTITYNIQIFGDTLFCPSDTVNIWVDSLLSNFVWNGPGIIDSSLLGDTVTVNVQGLYEYAGPSLIDSTTGCPMNVSGGSFFLYEKQEPAIWSNVSDNMICPGDSLLLTGDPGIAYEWIGPQGLAIGGNPTIWVDVPGFYYCLITDSSGCQMGSNTEELIEYNSPFIFADPGTSLCFSQVIELSVLHTGNPSFQWYGPITSTSDTIQVSQAGTYYVEVTQCGFTVTDSIVITPSTGVSEIISVSDTLICPGDTVVLTANSGMNSYTWNNGDFGEEIMVLDSGYYTVTTINNDGCILTSEGVLIEFAPSPLPPDLNAPEGGCFGETLTCYDNTGFFLYDISWIYDQQVVSTSNQLTISELDQNNIGTYTLVHEYLGCTQDTTFEILIYPDPVFNVSSNSPVCVGDNISLVATGDPSYVFDWTGPNFSGTSAQVTIADAQLLHQGVYVVDVTTQYGCTGSDSLEIVVNEYPILDIGDDTVVCEGLVFEIAAPSGFDSYLWSTGSDSTTIFVVDQNWYWVQVANANCWSIDSLQFKTKDCTVTPPNIFTPNGDGTNDVWTFPLSSEVSNPQIEIYNRWGLKVGEVSGDNPTWDGLHYQTGQELSEGVYFFIGTVTNGYNNEIGLDGFIHLIRVE